QFGAGMFSHLSKDIDDVIDALDWTEIRNMDQEAFVRLGKSFAQSHVGGASVRVAIHEIRDHGNLPLNLEFLHGSLPQVFGYCCTGVALLDAETDDGQVGSVVSN